MVGKKDKYLVAAQKLIERGQLDKALIEFAKVVQEDPKDIRTWLKMAELHAKRGSYVEATEIYLRTGELYTEQGSAQKAVAVYKNVLKLSPGTVTAHLKLGELFKQVGLIADAVQQFELAAVTLQRANKGVDAVAALRQAVEIQPENVVLRVKLAESASHAGLVEEAVREFGLAAEQLKAQGRADESLRVVERMLFHQPENLVRARELAEAYIVKGSARLALPKLQACLKSDPRDPHTLSLLARALEQLGQIPKAVSVLKELVFLCDDLGRSSERDAAILRGLTLDPSDAELRDIAARHQLRGTVGAENEATPPPIKLRDPAIAERGGSFDLSGSVRVPGAGMSGRVVMSVGGEGSGRNGGGVSLGSGGIAGPDISRTLAEADVFVKYGLLERAADHLGRVFEVQPDHREARERLIAVLQRLGRKQDAAREMEVLAELLARSDPGEARKLAEKALMLDHSAIRARILLETLASVPASEQPFDTAPGDDGDPTVNVTTPPITGIANEAANDTDAAIEAASEAASEAVTDTMIEGSANAATGADAGIETGLETVPGASALSLSSSSDALVDAMMFDLGPLPELADLDGLGLSETAFDVEVRTGDVGLSSAAAPVARNGFPASLDAVDVQTTPVPIGVDNERTPRIEDEAPDWISAVRDDDDSAVADAFSDHAATIAGAVEGLAELEQFVDEEELSAELDQVTFFIEQLLSDDARALLQDLELRFPGHPRVAAKLREVLAFESGLDALDGPKGAMPGAMPGAIPGAITRPPKVNATIIEKLSRLAVTPGPRAVVAGGAEADLSTHADLGIAYKGMGLYDAAIAEMKLLTQDPDREVFALTTMGECFEAKGSFTEAIIRYKRALNCTQVTVEETRALYFLLGAAFERLGDVSEALYFLEKVAKRDPKFRDVDQKIAELRPRLVKRAPGR